MKFFIDTANISEIEKTQKMGILDGVTTNPSLMAKEGIKGKKQIMECYKNICEIVDGDVSAEVLGESYEEMKREGEELAELHENIVVKIPMTENGIRVIKEFSEKEIKTNCTLVFSINQALLAAKAGATYVSPFIGRLDDIGSDGLSFVEELREMFDIYDFLTEILAASIRSPLHITKCAKIGADVATIPFGVITQLFSHPLTTKGLDVFLQDAKKLG